MEQIAEERRRRVIIHEDDVAMSHGANKAFLELSLSGACSSGSVMVPCSWFPEAAQMAADYPSLDLGVHLTLTSEKQPYRWRPLTSPPKSARLTDETGFFWPDVGSLRRNAVPEAVEAELRAQIDCALVAGIDVTHLDAHMGGVMSPEFVRIYLDLARHYRVPLLLVRDFDTYGPKHNLGEIDPGPYNEVVAEAEEQGFPIFSVALETPWHRTAPAEEAYAEMMRSIPEGLSFLSMHFNAPGDFEHIEAGFARIREEEYLLFKRDFVERCVEAHQLTVMGFREIRQELRRSWANPDKGDQRIAP